ncbi:ABC transporter substrate-binding protein [Kocuria sp. cx-455]|uniref:ABC transporter substrate-binding protein n=1 Tax=unclassified Candidatus Sulfotelmatobacter TaxID=2635724 RepID=UPI0016840423|nr:MULTISPECIES: ABC transporter substrate-binding protein [unclassified Candidatus Sulfotelmatobacter]MBD2761085.1 ABC transporter substrate-binding protein [Kocuria sp. cx-116]MBD2764674.1 ABC transporter substrate-binding protein [Kocuria sp. cx-455]
MKRTFSLSAAVAASALVLTACGSGGGDSQSEGPQEIKVGIAQFVEHPSLDAAREGFVSALEEGGYTEGDNLTLDVQNASGDQATATNIASNFASSDNDLILGIATPTAQSLAQAVTDKPVLFTAVTDPVDAGLVDSMDKPGANITGTTDMNPVAEQIELIKKFDPDAKSVGIIYSSGETNSQIQVEEAKKAAEAEGLTVEEKTVTTTAEVAQAAESFNTDSIYVPTDNKVVAGLEAVVGAAESKKIPLIVGEGDSVERGGLATQGISYEELGKQTGEMALRILNDDADPAEMAVESQNETQLIINAKAAAAMGVEIPQDLRDSADQVIE